MQHDIEYNIINVANQLFFAYQKLALKLRVFILSLIKSIKMVDFLRVFEKKKEIWHKMMTALTISQQYYNLVYRPLLFRFFLLSHFKAFYYF